MYFLGRDLKSIKITNTKVIVLAIILIAISVFIWNIFSGEDEAIPDTRGAIDGKGAIVNSDASIKKKDIPEYNGAPYVILNNNKAEFTKEDAKRLSSPGYEYYSALDKLGRCGYAEACVGPETRPEGERGSIQEVHPSGWQSGQGWERCHLIAWMLTGENANDHNLVTGCYTLNHEAMLTFEKKTDDYLDGTDRHVMYRVTPVFVGDEPICRGIQMEAKSVEDDGLEYNVYCFNVEPDKEIDYTTGYVKGSDNKNASNEKTIEDSKKGGNNNKSLKGKFWEILKKDNDKHFFDEFIR